MAKDQKDNSTVDQKIALWLNALRELKDPPVVMETHGGVGVLFSRCYRHVPRGVVFERDPVKAERLASQRPTWSVYEGDSTPAMAGGIGFHLPVNFFDVDPYGSCWPSIDAIFTGMRNQASRIVLAVHCGLRLHLRRGRVWKSDGSAARVIVETYGVSGVMFKNYGAFCKTYLTELAAKRGYGLKRWTIYYCGRQQDSTHFAAVLER